MSKCLIQKMAVLPNTLRGHRLRRLPVFSGDAIIKSGPYSKKRGKMKKSNTFGFCLLTIFTLIVSFRMLYASVSEQSDSAVGASPEVRQEVLKDRQQFNKLKRTTRNIYKVTMKSTVAFRLQTALGYVSTIDLPEKALKVFVGDQELFKVEVYEKQVLVKPITDETDAKTNILIITKSGRLAFDVSVGPADTADFVLDFRLPQDDEALVKNAFDQKVREKARELETHYEEKEKKLDQKAQEISEEKIKEKIAKGVQTIELKKSVAEGEIQANLLSLSQVADKAYLRFSILNYSKTPYRVLGAFLGIQTYEQKFIGKKESGMIEIQAELKLAAVIGPDAYEYGVLQFDYRTLPKGGNPVLRILEDNTHAGANAPNARNIEIKGFEWFK